MQRCCLMNNSLCLLSIISAFERLFFLISNNESYKKEYKNTKHFLHLSQTKISIRVYISIFFLTITILSNVNSADGLREYVIRRDFFNVLKAGELTVYDKSEKHILYRIESQIGLMQNIKLMSYPSKKVVGRLQAKIKPFLYKAEISILDPKSNELASGSIEENFKWTGSLFDIKWGDDRISMKKDAISFTNRFFDKDGEELLAEFRLRPASMFWTKKYDMKIYSNKYPEEIYFLGLAVQDHVMQAKKG